MDGIFVAPRANVGLVGIIFIECVKHTVYAAWFWRRGAASVAGTPHAPHARIFIATVTTRSVSDSTCGYKYAARSAGFGCAASHCGDGCASPVDGGYATPGAPQYCFVAERRLVVAVGDGFSAGCVLPGHPRYFGKNIPVA